jgi:hypothetical protein
MRITVFALLITVLALFLSTAAFPQIAVRKQGYVPYSEEPINYLSDKVSDSVAKLQQKLARGEEKLTYEPGRGYLRSVLEKLGIPVSSQTLVFSKTSFQFRKITPETPRALYFNDDVYVGWVRDGKAIEIVSFDATQGAIFYLLDEPKVEKPAFQRAELDCTQCHVAAATRGVPGVFVRSVYTNPTGTQAAKAPSFTTGQESPYNDRWGGWYVTGEHGKQAHMGNVVVHDREHPDLIDRAAGSNVTDLTKLFNPAPYLSPESDIVAHLVLDHQTQMHNLITLTNYKTRLALYNKSVDAKEYERPAEELVRYLLFANEAPLTEPVRGSSPFAKEFSAKGPRDPLGRSLRDFDLRTRTFKYPCSYLIYSDSFDAIPEPARQYVYRRLLEVLTGREQGPEFARLSNEDRRAVLEILLATKPGLPQQWKFAQRAARLSKQSTPSRKE